MHEVLLLKLLLENDAISLESFTNELKLKNVNFDGNVNRIIKVLSIDYYRQEDQKKYGNISYIVFDNKSKIIKKTDYFSDLLKDITYKTHITDVLDYAITKAQIKPNKILGDDNLIYYRKYSRKDVFKIMNFDKDQNPQNVGGYIIQEVDGRKMPCICYI